LCRADSTSPRDAHGLQGDQSVSVREDEASPADDCASAIAASWKNAGHVRISGQRQRHHLGEPKTADRLEVRGATTKIELGSWRAEGTSTIESTQARLEILSRDEAACFTVKRAYVVPDLEVTDQKYEV
jgi:hypothetical protein